MERKDVVKVGDVESKRLKDTPRFPAASQSLGPHFSFLPSSLFLATALSLERPDSKGGVTGVLAELGRKTKSSNAVRDILGDGFGRDEVEPVEPRGSRKATEDHTNSSLWASREVPLIIIEEPRGRCFMSLSLHSMSMTIAYLPVANVNVKRSGIHQGTGGGKPVIRPQWMTRETSIMAAVGFRIHMLSREGFNSI
ncbi:hypothetical protein SCHPADRAFT_509667 [Schizopora paradoxa]|uniref:Uncharacterized protein n=1 Tax=Schizopora paradoxa TaxID=27342 RepID=A0A0H2RFE3_9AGAM|nr:hypothetical protein SCHPADRAFT_509667 [Schizopora paradoxa]